ncbi:hypothetical protein PR001_g26661 [Phytophthora rubi]|uniref:Retrotransposon gag domain-containing protein n=1 Tax=Phytophthora rubi TaxID=129364 RepID=A0A6A3HP49_9STRA|nr:hypothetical protein PR001_g26661 [Phytophthora rubi]
MSTKPSPSASKRKGEKTESSLRWSLRVAGLPAEVEPKDAEKSGSSRSTMEVSAPSAEVEVSHPGEPEPSAEPEAPPPMPEDVAPSLSSPELKPSGAGRSDDAGAQSSVRIDEGRSQVVPAEHQNVAPQDKSEVSTTTSRLLSANPEPTAANPRGSQLEGGALSLLGSREMQLREQNPAWTGTDPVRLDYAPGAGYFGAASGGAWSSSLWPDQRPFQRLRGVPEGGEAQNLSLTHPSEMTEAEMITYGRSQLELWMSLPPGIVHPVEMAYAPRHEGYDLWGFIRAAGATARHLMSVTRSPAARWLNVFNAERRRIPIVSDLKAVRVSLGLMPPIACVALLQTMLHEAGYEFRNQVPTWHTLVEVSGVSESQIRLEIERIGHFIRAELTAWKFAVGSTPYYVRSPSDPQLTASAQTNDFRKGFVLDKDGDAIMDEDTQLFLGHEVVMRLQLTGVRPRSPASSLEEEPARKRPLLIRSSASGSIPSWRDSSDAASEVRPEAMSDSVPSMVGTGPNSDLSLMVTDESGNMSYSSSGLSLMSVTYYMLGSGTHLPMSTATVMRGSTMGVTRSSAPGMMISITPDPPQPHPIQTRIEARVPMAEHPAQIPLPGSPESKRTSEGKAEAAAARPDLGPSPSVRAGTEGFWFGHSSAQLNADESPAQRNLARSETTAWARFTAEQEQRKNTEARLQAALEDNRCEQTKFHEEYQKLQATNAQMSDAQRRTQVKQCKQLEALERLAEQRVVAETEKRKEDETRAQYVLGVQKKLQEAEIRARQEQLQRIHDERAAKTRAEHDVELLRLKEEHAQAQAAHELAVAEREEKLRQLLVDQERLRTQADSQNQPSHSTGSQDLSRIPAESSVILTVIDPVLAKLDRLTDVMHQMVQANQRQAEPVESRDKTTKTQSSSQGDRTKSSARTSSSASKRSSKTRTSRSRKPDDDDWGSDSSSSSDSSQDELEGQFGAAAQSKSSDAVSGTRVVVQAMVPHDALEKFDERGPLDDRANWWERFMYYATMAPWDERTRIVQLRMRLSGSLKNWCAQLPDSTRSDWKKLSHVFKKEWCRSIGSKAERYYAMEIRESETPRMFLYRLNRAAKKADIAFERPTQTGRLTFAVSSRH